VVSVVVLLGAVELLDSLGPRGLSTLVLGPPAAALLVVVARRSGLTWTDLGLARHTWRRGGVVAGVCVVLVAAVYSAGLLFPPTRSAFQDVRYQLPPGRALFTALVAVPFGTVLLEEIGFRGVLMGLMTRRGGVLRGLGVSSTLFGLWHVLPSLQITRTNAAVGSLAGSGSAGRIGAVLAIVAFTAAAGVLLGELRRRSGSLLASAGLHWAVNGVGVLFAAALFAVHGS
jgi:membrane protease YdiL (CAAX protease family)